MYLDVTSNPVGTSGGCCSSGGIAPVTVCVGVVACPAMTHDDQSLAPSAFRLRTLNLRRPCCPRCTHVASDAIVLNMPPGTPLVSTCQSYDVVIEVVSQSMLYVVVVPVLAFPVVIALTVRPVGDVGSLPGLAIGPIDRCSDGVDGK